MLRELTALYTYSYPRPAVSVDIVLVQKKDDDFQVLLIKRAKPPFQGSFALPGGFVNQEETLEQAAQRELWEETGLQNINLTQIHTFSDPDRDPRGRVISTAFGGIIEDKCEGNPQAGSDAAELGWFNLSNLPPLAFDHDVVIKFSVEKMNLIEL
ncbi:MAG: NUDIX hydrolase [Anaerolineales bacterium]|nr:NUDIX hydrolase [Anaerolineales bacterium]